MNKQKMISVDWHQADCLSIMGNEKCKCYKCHKCHKKCKCYKDCKDKPKEIFLNFVFKQQIYYKRCIGSQTLNWIPLIASNGSVFLNMGNNSQYSSLLNSPLASIQPVGNSPVVYPDYSGVDVGQGIKWPAQVFAPYIDSTAWPPYKFADLFPQTKVPFYNLGFIVSRTADVCEPSWGTYYGAADGPLNDQIKAIRQLGGDVTISFGGAASVPLHITAPDFVTLKEQYKRFIIAYGLTRIDFDLEGTWIDPSYQADNIKNAKAIKLLQDELSAIGKNIDIVFTLPVLPTGLTGAGLQILQLALNENVKITGVNIMTMDYGDSAAPNPSGRMGQYGIQAVNSLKNQLNTLYHGMKSEAELYAMIGTTPMIGQNDVQTEIFMQSDANETLAFCQNNKVGMISMWSANRDNTSQSGIPQSPFEFQSIFNKYNQ